MANLFVTVSRMTAKRGVGERIADTREISCSLPSDAMKGQADRCTDCGVPFCQSACPLGNQIPEWLRLAAEGRAREAWDMAASTSTMPEICGRICPQDRLCEGACTLEQAGFDAVTIGGVEAWLGDLAFENGWVEPVRIGSASGRSVGVVGAGPAGLAAADRLRERGHDVVVYDRHDQAGGLLTYGIPSFKLDKPVVGRRIQRLVEAGVAFRLGVEIGRDLSLDDLRARHDAVLLAMGVYEAVDLGWADGGPRPALDYLIEQNRADLGEAPVSDAARGRHVVVIGGGDTAMDCARTAIRQGAASVTCLYRRDRGNMPGSAREVANAEEEGVRFEWMTAPVGRSRTGLTAARTRLIQARQGGRMAVEAIPGSDFKVAADLVIAALGFRPEGFRAWAGFDALSLRADGTVQTRAGGAATNLPGFFMAGDAARGASLVVWAVRDGQDAAAEIDRYLAGERQEAAA